MNRRALGLSDRPQHLNRRRRDERTARLCRVFFVGLLVAAALVILDQAAKL
jgi:hypothetical protein